VIPDSAAICDYLDVVGTRCRTSRGARRVRSSQWQDRMNERSILRQTAPE
jgi:hypothetical protein